MEDRRATLQPKSVWGSEGRWYDLTARRWQTRGGEVGKRGQKVLVLPAISSAMLFGQPLDAAGLEFVAPELARLALTPEAITAFVARFGPLGVDVELDVLGKAREVESHIRCEQFDAWREAVTVFRIAWRAVEGDDQEPGEALRIAPLLGDVLFPVVAGRSASRSDPDVYRVYRCEIAADLPEVSPRPETLPSLPTPRAGDARGSWDFIVLGGDSPSLSELIYQAVATIVSHYTRVLVGAEVRVNRRRRVLHYVPRNLLGMAWAQFAEAITAAELTGPPEYPECPECGDLYRRRVADQTTCGSSSCRQKVLEKRMEWARTLADHGETVQSIAARTKQEFGKEFSPDQVERWINRSRRRRKGNKEA